MAVAKVERPLTGWHVLAMFVAFFGVIIAVNLTLAWQAISTFPGLEVENSYVASQTFDADRRAQVVLLGGIGDGGLDHAQQCRREAGKAPEHGLQSHSVRFKNRP